MDLSVPHLRNAGRARALRPWHSAGATVIVILGITLSGCAGPVGNSDGAIDEDAVRQARGCPYQEQGQHVELKIVKTFAIRRLNLTAGGNATGELQISVCEVDPPSEVELQAWVNWTFHGQPKPPANQKPEVLIPARIQFWEGAATRVFHVHVIVPHDSPPGKWGIEIAPRDWRGTSSREGLGIYVDWDKVTG